MSLFDMTGQVAVVTGSTKGIGLGIAQQMAAHGAKVIVSSRDQALCDRVAGNIDGQYGKSQTVAKGIAFDLNAPDDIERFARDCEAAFGRVDTLVCNAAILQSADSRPTFDRILSGNIHHNYLLCEAFRPIIARCGGGSILLIGSVAGQTPMPSLMAYATAKAGLAHMGR